MVAVLLTVVLALIAKDVLPLGDRYVLRGVSEGLALLAGALWIVQHGTASLFKRYMPVVGYVLVLLLTVLITKQPEYVALQWVTLLGVFACFISYSESSRDDVVRANASLFHAIIVTLTLVCSASLLLLYLKPALAYGYEENLLATLRFKGVYGEAGQIASAAGLLLGLAIFFPWHWWIRLMALLTAGPCLYLTGTRGAWVAAVVGATVTWIRYKRLRLSWCLGVGVGAALVVLGLVAADMRLSPDRTQSIVRADSLENLSGRLTVWKFALKKFGERPWLGYGFTAGADAFDEREGSIKSVIGAKAAGLRGSSAIDKKSYSLHNGYIQALLDSGVFGAGLYLGIMLLAAWKFVAYDRDRRYGAEFYAFLFLVTYNLTHSLILGAATFDSVLYWYLAIFALSLKICSSTAIAPAARKIELPGQVFSHGEPPKLGELQPVSKRRFSIIS